MESHDMEASPDFRLVRGFEHRYSVSSDGRVFSIRTGRILKAAVSARGYRAVCLWDGRGRQRVRPIHCLVAEAFLGDRPHGFVVNHKDGDKLNNAVANLEFCTVAENVRHAFLHGLQPPTRRRRAKVTQQGVVA